MGNIPRAQLLANYAAMLFGFLHPGGSRTSSIWVRK
jgi:hypothetical protein